MLKPMEKEINGKIFVLSKIPAREGMQLVGKIANNLSNKLFYDDELIDLIFAYVGVKIAKGQVLNLSTQALINSHLDDWEQGVAVLTAMIEYNCSFLQNGMLSDYLDKMRSILSPSNIETSIQS